MTTARRLLGVPRATLSRGIHVGDRVLKGAVWMPKKKGKATKFGKGARAKRDESESQGDDESEVKGEGDGDGEEQGEAQGEETIKAGRRMGRVSSRFTDVVAVLIPPCTQAPQAADKAAAWWRDLD